jgi:hypothetical protein
MRSNSLGTALFLEVAILAVALFAVAVVPFLALSYGAAAVLQGNGRDAYRAVSICAMPFCGLAIALGLAAFRSVGLVSVVTQKKEQPVLVAVDRQPLLTLAIAALSTSVSAVLLIAAMAILMGAAVSGKSPAVLAVVVILLAALVIALIWLLETAAAALTLRASGNVSRPSNCLTRADPRAPHSPTRFEPHALEF